jgi:hypothetical protein
MTGDQQSALFFLFIVGLAFCWHWKVKLRDARIRRMAEAAREQKLAADAGERQRQEQYQRTRTEARERARIAFPELLDESEAKGFDKSHPGLRELSGPDYDLIYEARKFVREEIEAIKAANPDWPHSASLGKELEPLDEDLSTLESVDEDCGHDELDLGTPARIIDCGAAGQVNLYTAAEVENARNESGVTKCLALLDLRARAPELAKQIVERAKLVELKKREAEEAHLASITTKLEELPPVVAKHDDQ